MSNELEWLETNGTGGFACGSIAGEVRRKWHGLLWAAKRPPRERVRILVGLHEHLLDGGAAVALGSVWKQGRWEPPAIAAQFDAWPMPRWSWTLPSGAVLSRELFMPNGTTDLLCVRYLLKPAAGEASVNIMLRPILPAEPRELHLYGHAERRASEFREQLRRIIREAPLPSAELREFLRQQGISSDDELESAVGGLGDEGRSELLRELEEEFAHDGTRISARKLLRRVMVEAEKDCEDVWHEDLQLGPRLHYSVAADQPRELVFSGSPLAEIPAVSALYDDEVRRRLALKVVALQDRDPNLARRLGYSADQFITRIVSTNSSTIMAGYPWFSDWGRDAMIALPGLCLATGRTAQAREIIRHFLQYLDKGIVPNLFPELGEKPMYNTVDATLWLVDAFSRVWSIEQLREEHGLWERVKSIFLSHVEGTHNDTRVDTDGLLRAGSEGSQLTWMDVKVNGEVPTPRHGKAVEIQGLWYNALMIAAETARALGEPQDEANFRAMAEKCRDAFARRFFSDRQPWPADVVDRDAPGTEDFSLRPNAAICFALTHNIIPEERRAAVLRTIAAKLLTPRGLRTLSPDDPRYKPRYRGNVLTRDRAYHQGTVWLWPLFPYVKGVVKEREQVPELFAQLPTVREEVLRHFEKESCVNSASEIFDAEAPHTPRGCFAQAWSVAAIIEIVTAVEG